LSRRRRRGQGGAPHWLGVGLIVLAVLVLGGLTAAGVLMRPPPIDEETLCRTDAPLRAHTVVLVDATDRLEPRHRRKLRAVLAQERERLEQYDRLTVMRLNVRRPQEPVVVFSKCLPRPPEKANPLFENARLAQARWDETFEDVLDRALRSAQSGGGARASPIIASLRAAALDASFGDDIGQRRLVLVSDLLEHQPDGFSLYVSGANFAAWDAQEGVDAPDFSGLAIRLAPLDRPEQAPLQRSAVDNFWAPFLDASGAQTVSIDRGL
jgi:hypothetical protein